MPGHYYSEHDGEDDPFNQLRTQEIDDVPDFNELHRQAKLLADLTEPGKQEDGCFTWCIAVGETWNRIANMWSEKIPLVEKATLNGKEISFSAPVFTQVP